MNAFKMIKFEFSQTIIIIFKQGDVLILWECPKRFITCEKTHFHSIIFDDIQSEWEKNIIFHSIELKTIERKLTFISSQISQQILFNRKKTWNFYGTQKKLLFNRFSCEKVLNFFNSRETTCDVKKREFNFYVWKKGEIFCANLFRTMLKGWKKEIKCYLQAIKCIETEQILSTENEFYWIRIENKIVSCWNWNGTRVSSTTHIITSKT